MKSKTVTRHDDKNIFRAIGFSDAKAQVLTIKADINSAIYDAIKKKGLTQAQVAKLWGQAQPRVSEVMRGKIDLVTIDKLVNYLALLGGRVDAVVTPPASNKATTRR